MPDGRPLPDTPPVPDTRPVGQGAAGLEDARSGRPAPPDSDPIGTLHGGPRASARSAQTVRARHGVHGEALAAAYVERLGWRVLARRVRVARDEIDLVAIEPGSPPTLVIVEVRSRATSRFGTAEESVDRRKVARLYRAALGLRRSGVLPDGSPVPELHWRVDLIAIDDAPAIGPGAGGPAIRHVRALEPG